MARYGEIYGDMGDVKAAGPAAGGRYTEIWEMYTQLVQQLVGDMGNGEIHRDMGDIQAAGPAARGRYGEIWGDTRRYGRYISSWSSSWWEIWGDMGRYSEIWEIHKPLVKQRVPTSPYISLTLT